MFHSLLLETWNVAENICERGDQPQYRTLIVWEYLQPTLWIFELNVVKSVRLTQEWMTPQVLNSIPSHTCLVDDRLDDSVPSHMCLVDDRLDDLQSYSQFHSTATYRSYIIILYDHSLFPPIHECKAELIHCNANDAVAR